MISYCNVLLENDAYDLQVRVRLSVNVPSSVTSVKIPLFNLLDYRFEEYLCAELHREAENPGGDCRETNARGFQLVGGHFKAVVYCVVKLLLFALLSLTPLENW